MKGESAVLILVLILLLAFAIYYFSSKQVIKRKFKKAIHKSISQVKDGEIVKIVGQAKEIGEKLVSPITERDCLYYQVEVIQIIRSGKSSHHKTLLNKSQGVKFLIEQDQHFACINVDKIKGLIVNDRKFKSHTFNDAEPFLEIFLRKNQLSSVDSLGFNKSLKYWEGIVEPNEKVAVLGKCFWKKPEDLGLDIKYGKILSVEPIDNDFVYLSDYTDIAKLEIDDFAKRGYIRIS